MIRLLFVMVTTVLIGLGSGYFLWGTRVARLTEALNGLTLEIDTLRARMANPEPGAGNDARATDELRVINEGVAAVRQAIAEQKPLLEKVATTEVSTGAASNAELNTVKSDLAACIADKLDLQAKCGGGGGADGAGADRDAPAYRPQPATPPSYRPSPPFPPAAPPAPPAYRPY